MSDKRLNFYGLGSFYFSNGKRVFNGNNWVSNKAMYVFMYLLFKREINISSEKLVEVFWPQSDLERGRKKLYDTIYLLRKSLDSDGLSKDIVESNNGYYSINSDYKIWTDWEYFDSKTDKLINKEEKIEIKALKNLFEFYRGNFFADLNYADWTEIYREELKQRYLNLIEIMATRMYSSKKYLDLLYYLNKGLNFDPYREKFYLLKIKTLDKLGRIAEAINCFKECKNILKEDLGVPPQQELKNELKRIKRDRASDFDNIEIDIEENLRLESGAMECSSIKEFKSVFELEIRQVQRDEDKEYLLVTLDFTDNDLTLSDLRVTVDKIAARFKKHMRLGDYICPASNKIHLILQDMSLDNSGVIIKRFNHFFKKKNFSQTPKVDIKEIN